MYTWTHICKPLESREELLSWEHHPVLSTKPKCAGVCRFYHLASTFENYLQWAKEECGWVFMLTLFMSNENPGVWTWQLVKTRAHAQYGILSSH